MTSTESSIERYLFFSCVGDPDTISNFNREGEYLKGPIFDSYIIAIKSFPSLVQIMKYVQKRRKQRGLVELKNIQILSYNQLSKEAYDALVNDENGIIK